MRHARALLLIVAGQTCLAAAVIWAYHHDLNLVDPDAAVPHMLNGFGLLLSLMGWRSYLRAEGQFDPWFYARHYQRMFRVGIGVFIIGMVLIAAMFFCSDDSSLLPVLSRTGRIIRLGGLALMFLATAYTLHYLPPVRYLKSQ
jgi:hypothetical protein